MTSQLNVKDLDRWEPIWLTEFDAINKRNRIFSRRLMSSGGIKGTAEMHLRVSWLLDEEALHPEPKEMLYNVPEA